MTALIYLIANTYAFGLLIYSICSWFMHPITSKLRLMLQPFYEPILQKIRYKLMSFGVCSSIDFSPMILFVIILIARSVLASLFYIPGV